MKLAHQPETPEPTLQKLTADDATQQNWPKDTWATQLAGLLTGDALDAFTSVPSADSSRYEEVKPVILSCFEVNAETYRQRFQKDAKKQG